MAAVPAAAAAAAAVAAQQPQDLPAPPANILPAIQQYDKNPDRTVRTFERRNAPHPPNALCIGSGGRLPAEQKERLTTYLTRNPGQPPRLSLKTMYLTKLAEDTTRGSNGETHKLRLQIAEMVERDLGPPFCASWAVRTAATLNSLQLYSRRRPSSSRTR